MSLATDLPTVPLKLLLTVLDVNVNGFILSIAKVDEPNWYCSYTDLTKIHNMHLLQNTD